MDRRDILIYLAVKFDGDWNNIYSFISNKEKLDEEEAKALLEEVKSSVVTIFDDDYPEQLKMSYRPPFVLFYHGDLSLIKDRSKCLSVVGSRKCSEYGKESTIKLVKKLCKKVVIVSGMASGIDSIAHETAIKYGGKTVAVLGTGINNPFPPESKELYNELVKNHLVISEYPNKVCGCPSNFPMRNRIVAGLSKCLLITEGKMKSGTSITARLTLDSGGDVCCIPTRIGEDSICNHLISFGAYLVESAEDVLYVMDINDRNNVF